jgi:hypothetical protein
MQLQRNLENSVYYALMDAFTINISGEVMSTTDCTTYKSKFNNWSPTGNVAVQLNGSPVLSGINMSYTSGNVIFPASNKISDIVTLTYSPCSLYYSREYPDNYEDVVLPSVAIMMSEMTETPYELGNASSKIMKMWFDVVVFAQRMGQRSDIVDTIKCSFDMDVPAYDYNLGFPYNSNGSVNVNFPNVNQKIGFIVNEDNINITNSRSLRHGNVEQYMSALSFLLSYYR